MVELSSLDLFPMSELSLPGTAGDQESEFSMKFMEKIQLLYWKNMETKKETKTWEENMFKKKKKKN